MIASGAGEREKIHARWDYLGARTTRGKLWMSDHIFQNRRTSFTMSSVTTEFTSLLEELESDRDLSEKIREQTKEVDRVSREASTVLNLAHSTPAAQSKCRLPWASDHLTLKYSQCYRSKECPAFPTSAPDDKTIGGSCPCQSVLQGMHAPWITSVAEWTL